MTNAFLTGSRAYGTPRDNSDTDVCILLSSDDLEKLVELAPHTDGSDEYDGSDGSSIRFGKLNLLCFCETESFNAWREATDELVARRPVTREQAVELISGKLKDIRVAAGYAAFAAACGKNDSELTIADGEVAS